MNLIQPTTDHALNQAPETPSIPEQSPEPSPTPETIKPAPETPKKDYALITGASSGIGQAFARILAAKKKPLILIGQNEERLKAIAGELRAKEGIDVRFLPINLARSKDLPNLPGKLQRMGINIDILINNAGFGKYNLETDIKYEDALNMINLNCRSTLALIKLFLPEMIKRHKGAIINIASLAGFFPVPMMATYSASKAFVINYSQALAKEVKPYGIKILCSCPGPTSTNFYKTAGINTSEHNELKDLSDPQTVAEQTIEALKQGKELVITGKIPFWLKLAPKIFPQSILNYLGSNFLQR
ncbi:MAG: SDR family NAD(P)-dependent oxidoreductase [Patescibacteria group bacterium]